MTRDETRAAIEVMKAWIDGKIIEARSRSVIDGPRLGWNTFDADVEPIWDWPRFSYRAKPTSPPEPPPKRYTCTECGAQVYADQVLRACNPFVWSEKIQGCPDCRSVNTLRPVCDEPGCWSAIAVGWLSPTGYRNTCRAHGPDALKDGSR